MIILLGFITADLAAFLGSEAIATETLAGVRLQMKETELKERSLLFFSE